jgi:hypothetical protein
MLSSDESIKFTNFVEENIEDKFKVLTETESKSMINLSEIIVDKLRDSPERSEGKLRDSSEISVGEDQISVACEGKLVNHRIFEEQEAIENSPEFNVFTETETNSIINLSELIVDNLRASSEKSVGEYQISLACEGKLKNTSNEMILRSVTKENFQYLLILQPTGNFPT